MLDDYLKDTDLADEPQALLEVHAIRLRQTYGNRYTAFFVRVFKLDMGAVLFKFIPAVISFKTSRAVI
jgi:hypothetical protein